MIQLDKREAFPFSSNPFGLVYENAITENKENEERKDADGCIGHLFAFGRQGSD